MTLWKNAEKKLLSKLCRRQNKKKGMGMDMDMGRVWSSFRNGLANVRWSMRKGLKGILKILIGRSRVRKKFIIM